MKVLNHSLKLSHYSLNKVQLDDELAAIVRAANPIAATKTTSMLFEGAEDNLDLLAFQSPMLCYFRQRQLYLLSGFYTFTKLLSFAVNSKEETSRLYPLFVMEGHLSRATRRHIILHALTQSLLNEAFVTNATAIGEFLNAWFEKDNGAKSIYQSTEWQAIYPTLTTKEKVSDWLHISKKQL